MFDMKWKYIVITFLSLFVVSVGADAAKQRGAAQNNSLDKGYRGMADMGFTIGLGGDAGYNRFGFSSTHGYQVVPSYLFIGGGVETDYYRDGSGFAIPLYFDVRTNIDVKVSPFVDIRVGGSPTVIKGFYFSPSVGVRIPIDKTRYGISIAAGYSFQTGSFDYYAYDTKSVVVDKEKMAGVHIKVEFEW